MCQIAINIPDAVLYDTRMSKEETYEFARRAVALGYWWTTTLRPERSCTKR